MIRKASLMIIAGTMIVSFANATNDDLLDTKNHLRHVTTDVDKEVVVFDTPSNFALSPGSLEDEGYYLATYRFQKAEELSGEVIDYGHGQEMRRLVDRWNKKTANSRGIITDLKIVIANLNE